jgi:hypothetical protein
LLIVLHLCEHVPHLSQRVGVGAAVAQLSRQLHAAAQLAQRGRQVA